MKFSPLILVFLLLACSDRDRKEEAQNFFKKEIDNRMASIKNLEVADSLQLGVAEVDKEVDRLLLMSKDIENIGASINLSKKFFDELVVKYQMNRGDFTDINRDMSLEEIANALKGNELNFFNQFIFKYKDGQGAMYTAQ
jgi:hypothetical protein